MDNIIFNFQTPIQMRWKDMDAMGHVNNATYLTYFEIARSYYIMDVCPDWNWKNDMFLIANINVDYLKELTLTDTKLNVHVRTIHIGNKSFVLEYLLSSGIEESLKIHAKGTSTQIMFDMKTRSSMPIPQWVREALVAYDELE